MTKREYERLYAEARRTYPKLTRVAMRKLAQVYQSASEEVAAAVREATKTGKSQITIDSMAAIEAKLQAGASALNSRLHELIPDTVYRGMDLTAEVNQQYLIDAVKIAGAESLVPHIHSVFANVQDKVIQSVVNRVYQGGYTYSDAIWKVGARYQDDIKNVLSVGLAQGRDMVKIARDIQVYTKEGKIALAKRLGALERPSTDFMKRIGNKVDWRALRLVRSELFQAVQDANKEFGKNNPACLDLYDWVMESGRQQWSCECANLSAGSPYTYNELPDYPHPGCSCSVRPVLRDGKEFIADLKTFIDGGSVDYLDEWLRVA